MSRIIGLLNRLRNALAYLDSFSEEERARRKREEAAAYHYIRVMQEREREYSLLQRKKKELAALIEEGKVGEAASQGLIQEMELKERLLDTKVMEVERTRYNAWILEGFEKQNADRRLIQAAREEIGRLETEGGADQRRLQEMKRALSEKEGMMDRFAGRLPGLPVD